MKKIFLTISCAAAIFFSGCAKNQALTNFEDTQLNPSALKYTKKTDIIVNNEPKIQFFATYLNPVHKDVDKGIESFIVGVYFVNEKEQDFRKYNYNVMLNEDKPLAKPYILSAKSLLVKSLPIKNPWGNYYIFHFPKQDGYNLKLKLINDKGLEKIKELKEEKKEENPSIQKQRKVQVENNLDIIQLDFQK
ncbi:hypothetical protein CPU12_06640 [Malaciobacter molluscorum LMG 25693]|uniref:Lipoprotein n=1 Tax=Malaciobacter molluscorum LMG 25693 TaxID=870501 RepID=A0A2G1DI21_9BACT|nr:hypothetical protein [Malaciobacter molluscorum]AXX92411.1 hypothetical protein AMOL_1441 [Malaciobacter molluscorum LMG 25693]PHO18143.1 hypothetical protein CPU12_06640 [Malaciobacter molluscorum LMG 25693]